MYERNASESRRIQTNAMRVNLRLYFSLIGSLHFTKDDVACERRVRELEE